MIQNNNKIDLIRYLSLEPGHLILSKVNQIDKLFHKYFFTEDEPLIQMIKFLAKLPGKKIRPMVLLLCADIGGNIPDVTATYATLLEVLHTASLIHDDIIDIAEIRRGENSMNNQYGNKFAVLAGDFLLSRSLSILSQKNQVNVIEIYSRASEDLCIGEILEQKCRMESNFSEKLYFKIINKKTASLFSACCEIGVICAKGPKKLQKMMKEFGENLGLAFQLKDDLLDFIGDCKNTGKETGKDFSENIMTYPLLTIDEKLSNHEHKIINDIRQKDFDSVEFNIIAGIIKKHNGFIKTEQKILEYSHKCKDILGQLPPLNSRNILEKLLDYNIDRNS